MRIGFLGKGGSGKTTMAAWFIKFAAKRHPFVLAIDADCNAHLKSALNFNSEPQLLGSFYEEIMEYLKGTRTDLGDRPFICTTPPSLKSRFVSITQEDPLIAQYSLSHDNISLLTVGPYEKADVGTSCYHTKLMGITAVFHHMLDTPSDVVVADTTAGIDNVAGSLNFVYDMNVFIVEPTLKSVKVYLDFIEVVPYLYNRTFIVANKVDGQEDLNFLEEFLPKDKILGIVPTSLDLKRAEQGDQNAGEKFYAEHEQLFVTMYETLSRQTRDWDEYLDYLRKNHNRVSLDWWNSFYSADLVSGLDHQFTYQAVIPTLSQNESASARNSHNMVSV
jgi:CO dehydrogenase maturation factor